jgi:PAS domain S-box-containing protein
MKADSISIRNYINKGSFYRAVVEDGADIIFIVDYEGIIYYHNPSVKNFLGYSDGELIDKNFIEQNHPEYRSRLTKTFKEISKEKYADNIEFYFRKKNGEYTYLEFNSINLHHKDQIDALLLDCRDISQRKKDAEELIKAQKAKELFLANMSHEIRTPISGIAGMVTLLEQFDRNPEEMKYLNAIKHSAEHLKIIINDILDFAAIEAGKLTFENIGFRPYEQAGNVVNSFEYNLKDKGLEIDFSFDGEKDLIVKGDPVRLNQVLVNLINNAIKFTPQGGVNLSVKISKQGEKYLATYCVKDTGIGIPHNKRMNLFESFSQADTSINRRFGGTGLGLAISKHIVNIQGGRIWFESEVDQGSTFCFEIPFEPGNVSDLVTEKKEKKSDETSLDGLRVLLAEDNEINKLYTTKVLSGLNCKVETVENGKDCVDLLEKNNFDLVLMDLQMPIMDGFEATKIIREKLPNPKKEITIIALTANAIKGDNEKCLAAGMNDYLSKPFTPENLKKKILRWVKRPGHSEITKASSDSVIDLTYLRTVCNNDESFLKEMITTFRNSTPELLDQMESALSQDDIITVSKIAHKIKPSISFMGIQSALQGVSEIENTKAAPLPSGYNQMVLDFLKEIRKALIELDTIR